MKIAIYARVSTEEQDADKQVYICRNYAEANGHEIFNIYKDVISGAKCSRPEFNLLLQDMRLYRFRGVIVTKLDRVGRSLQHLLSLFDEFKNRKVEFIAVTQNIDTSTVAYTLSLRRV